MPTPEEQARDKDVFKRLSAAGSGTRRDPSAQERKAKAVEDGILADDGPLIAEARRLARTASGSQAGNMQAANISFATGRPRDPMFYWRENNLPFDVAKSEELVKIRDFCRLLYITHPVIPSIIDIYAQWPVVDLRLECKDKELEDFYGDLFLDRLEYADFLVDVGREYWTVGEAFPLGYFNETLGIWESDELINPNDVKVIRSPFLREPRLEMKVPEIIREILKNQDPPYEYQALLAAYPEFKKYMHEDDYMPVSNVLMKQLKFVGDPYHPRGIPILMRAFRTIVQEEMLNAARDSIAERLYTPLIFAKLGASASDLGTTSPWIPTAAEKESFLDSLDAALAADFRVLVTHFATDIKSVFGKETLPGFGDDFDQLTDRILQVFGMSKTLLTGAGAGQTYAADALNRDLITQLLTHDQKRRIKLMRDRMLVVAEAQEHFDYEERGGIKYPIMEEVLIVDPESGQERIEERPRLLVPEVVCRSMSLADEQDERQFLEALRDKGIPISQSRRLVNTDVDITEEAEKIMQEQVDQAVMNQETRRATYKALLAKNLPRPQDLEDDFGPKATVKGTVQPAAVEEPIETIGNEQAASTMALAPTDADIAASDEQPNDEEVVNATQPLVPRNRQSQRPAESDDARGAMPKESRLSGPSVTPRRRRKLDKDIPLDDQV